jgi:hypothetical protein
MSQTTARAVATVGIWAAVAVILAFGAFQQQWSGDLISLVVFVVCGAACVSTVVVWGWGPGKPVPDARPEDRQASA